MAVDYEALLVIQTEFRKIADALKNVEVKNLNDINVSNLDEVKAHLRNELRPVILAINSLSKVMGKASSNANPKLNYEIKIPEVIKLADFDALKKSITDLAAILKGKEFNPTIKVNVPDVIVPDIKIPEIKIPDIVVPEPKITVNPASLNLDLTELLDALEPLKFLSNKATNPISVRLSDGQKFIKALQNVADKAGQVVTSFSASSGMSGEDYKHIERDGDDILARYKCADTDDDASPNYYGFLDKEGNWYILQEVLVAGANTYRYVRGTADYATNWGNRAGLTYDYFSEVF